MEFMVLLVAVMFLVIVMISWYAGTLLHKIDECDAAIEMLRARVGSLGQSATEASVTRDEARQRCIVLEDKVAAYEVKCKSLESQNDALAKSVEEAVTARDGAFWDRANCKERIVALEAELDRCKGEWENVVAAVAMYKALHENADKENGKLKNKLDWLTNQYEHTVEEFNCIIEWRNAAVKESQLATMEFNKLTECLGRFSDVLNIAVKCVGSTRKKIVPLPFPDPEDVAVTQEGGVA